MPDYCKLLFNLEENIFFLVQRRDYKLNLEKGDIQQLKIKTQYYTKEHAEKNINIDLSTNREIIDIYFEKFKTVIPIDIDILNLIVKYISVCGKILNIELNDIFGVRELNWCPKNSVKFLDTDYIVNKYKGKYSWGVNEDMIKDMRYIFLNIIIPFSNKHMYQIYNDIK